MSRLQWKSAERVSGLSYPHATLGGILEKTASRHPDRIATTLYDTDITYGELGRKADAAAHAFAALGVRKGDRVALILPNSPTYVIAFFGLMKMGAIAMNVNVMTQGDELAGLLRAADARVVVTLDLFVQNVLKIQDRTPVRRIVLHSVFGLEKAMEAGAGADVLIFNDLISAHPSSAFPLNASPDDIAVLQNTSGSTGTPKTAALTHRSFVANILQIDATMPAGGPANAGVICIIPFFHIFGLTICLLISVFKAYRMILVPQFDWSSILSLLELIEKYRPYSFPAVSPLWAALVSHPEAGQYPLQDIGIASGGGAPLPQWVQENYKRLTGRMILEAYGLSETASTTHMNPPDRAVSGSIGLALPDTSAKIVDMESGERELPNGEVGELIVKGPQVMTGYWNNPELTRKAIRDGWLYTGDLARKDDNGYFYLVDRKDDMIISSGYNVYPSDVEAALRSHPKVEDAAVVGQPDALRGQVIKAFVVLKDGVEGSREEFLAHCRAILPAFKIPKIVEFRDGIPKNPAGKTLRRVLRRQ